MKEKVVEHRNSPKGNYLVEIWPTYSAEKEKEILHKALNLGGMYQLRFKTGGDDRPVLHSQSWHDDLGCEDLQATRKAVEKQDEVLTLRIMESLNLVKNLYSGLATNNSENYIQTYVLTSRGYKIATSRVPLRWFALITTHLIIGQRHWWELMAAVIVLHQLWTIFS